MPVFRREGLFLPKTFGGLHAFDICIPFCIGARDTQAAGVFTSRPNYEPFVLPQSAWGSYPRSWRHCRGVVSMKQPGDDYTRDIFNKPGRGRPRKPNAKTAAQRAKEYRNRERERKFNFLRGQRNEIA